ncbi:MAG: response regulator [Elusimicrobiales bacterium]|nr:response regulator [Elusimicrobiales bacterium]
MEKVLILKEKKDVSDFLENLKRDLVNNFEVNETTPKDLLKLDYDILIIFGSESFIKEYEEFSSLVVSINSETNVIYIKNENIKFRVENIYNLVGYIKILQNIDAKKFFPEIVFYSSNLEIDWPWYLKNRTIEKILNIPFKNFRDDPYLWKTRINPQHIERVKKRKMFLLSDSKCEFMFQIQDYEGKLVWFLSKEIYIPSLSKTAGLLINIDNIKKTIDKQTINLKMDFLHEFLSVTTHQINNFLSSIIGYLEVIDKKINKYPEISNEFNELNNSIKKLIEVVNRYTMFSNRIIFKKEKINISELIDYVKEVIRLVIRKDIKGIIRIDEKNLFVEADPIILQQIIYGLCAYLSEFIIDGGELIISLRREEKIIISSVSNLETSARNFAVINIAGRCNSYDLKNLKDLYFIINNTDTEKIYSYFSFQSIEKNIEKLGGWLKIDKLEDFLFFEFKIPLYDVEKSLVERIQYQKVLSHKVKKILICEDDEGLRRFVERILKENGYLVVSCSKINEMINILKNENIDLIFTDIELEDGNSFDLINRIKMSYPQIKIIFNSGYVDSKSRWYEIEKKGFKFIQKPYTIRELINTIEEELNN